MPKTERIITFDIVLSLRPKPFDGVGMAVANNINLVSMLDGGMVEPERRQVSSSGNR
jgi:hypothetical protein